MESEEIKINPEIKTKCTTCGICKFSCPIFVLAKNEAVSPRGKAVLLKQSFPSNHFYMCTMCKACEEACILKDIDLVDKIRDMRKDLIELGMTTEANRMMIDNIRKHGNALGKVEPGKKIQLFCC